MTPKGQHCLVLFLASVALVIGIAGIVIGGAVPYAIRTCEAATCGRLAAVGRWIHLARNTKQPARDHFPALHHLPRPARAVTPPRPFPRPPPDFPQRVQNNVQIKGNRLFAPPTISSAYVPSATGTWGSGRPCVESIV